MALLKLLRILSIVCVSLASLGQSMHSFQVIENGEETLFVGRVHTDGSLQEEYRSAPPHACECALGLITNLAS